MVTKKHRGLQRGNKPSRRRTEAAIVRATVKGATERVKAWLKRRQRPGGPPAKRETSRMLQGKVDCLDALDMKAKGLSFRQIGAQLGCSHVRARELVIEGAATVDLALPQMAATVRAVEGATCDEVKRSMLPLMHGQIPAGQAVVRVGRSERLRPTPNDPIEVARVQAVAAQRVLNASQRIAALYGADAPIRVAPTDPTGTRRYHDLTTEELQRMIVQQETLLGQGGRRPVLVGDNGDGEGG